MANDKAGPSEISSIERRAADAREPSLGSILTEARKRRGISADDLMRQTRIPAYYVRMIENDDYELIADQLYVLPFLRKYAAFVGLDAEEITTRFIRDVQRADSNAGRMPDPIPVDEPTASRGGRVWIAAIVAAAIVLAIVTYVVLSRRHRSPTSAAPNSSVAVTSRYSSKPAQASALAALVPASASPNRAGTNRLHRSVKR